MGPMARASRACCSFEISSSFSLMSSIVSIAAESRCFIAFVSVRCARRAAAASSIPASGGGPGGGGGAPGGGGGAPAGTWTETRPPPPAAFAFFASMSARIAFISSGTLSMLKVPSALSFAPAVCLTSVGSPMSYLRGAGGAARGEEEAAWRAVRRPLGPRRVLRRTCAPRNE